jgi:hypothetical protein
VTKRWAVGEKIHVEDSKAHVGLFFYVPPKERTTGRTR